MLPSKCDEVEVQAGDMLIYRTAGGGGWKDRLDRPAEVVARDVSFGLVSAEKALSAYGVVLRTAWSTPTPPRPSGRASVPSAARRRRSTSGPSWPTRWPTARPRPGLAPPQPAKPLRWSPLESGEDARARVRAAWEAEISEGNGHP